MNIKALKGFKDIVPSEVETWQRVEAKARDIFQRFGFAEIKVPILESTQLFKRSIGETTDIVEKEMYTFTDRNGDSVTLRPEGTASVLRAFIEHSLHTLQAVQKLYTIGPMFRHERPQKGRLRQFHQMSVEALGSEHPRLDAEVIAMAAMIIRELGLSVSLEINSLGCRECRPSFNKALVDFLGSCSDLCGDCERRRLTNPLRVLDCKNEKCQAQYTNAPSIPDYLCPGCAEHFNEVKKGLDLLETPYKVNPFMVRGLDYYTRTTFELITGDLGAQSAVGAGGRYDGLVEQLGGPALPGIGFAVGMERLVLLLAQQESAAETAGIDIFIAALGEKALEMAYRISQGLRVNGLSTAMDLEGRGLKNQMKQAGKQGARSVLILGEDELAAGRGVLRNMASREQEEIELPGDFPAWCKSLANKIK